MDHCAQKPHDFLFTGKVRSSDSVELTVLYSHLTLDDTVKPSELVKYQTRDVEIICAIAV